ncbi:hypothetical protein D0863_00879 [Hortaea werneckii]|uniref:Integral membrane protein n=1 Tax=Hortaea werneckii TaxID=91943 RepID=A0A3M7ENH7_HORWE|nr:hypothetical protein D0863_00879 [Hortaea werneckii]
MGDYFSNLGRRRGSSAAGEHLTAPVPGPQGHPQQARPTFPRHQASRDSLRAPSSIRIRRLPSSNLSQDTRPAAQRLAQDEGVASSDQAETSGRRRSSSAPQRYGVPGHQQSLQQQYENNRLSRQLTVGDAPHMSTINEGQQLQPSRNQTPFREQPETPGEPYTPSVGMGTPGSEMPASERVASGVPAMTEAADAARQNRGLRRFRTNTGASGRGRGPMRDQPAHDEYQADVVGLLDLLDPEVRTLGTLTNVQNSLFVPDLGGLINRRPTYELTPRTTDIESRPRTRAGTRASQRPQSSRLKTTKEGEATAESGDIEMQPAQRKTSISSQLSDSHYAVLPHGVDLEGWEQEDIDELNDHVRHLLHSRREGFKRSMRGFGKYISKPLGLFVFVYAVLVTLFGAAWVFCLIGWIYVGDRQDYFINVIDLILVALFALMGDGLAPFRAVDTYHMCFIAHYHHLTWRLRKEKNLPNLVDHNDLPDRRIDVERADDLVDKEETAEFSVLSPQQQRRLQYHQAKFSKAHTFYKPHETATHHAFPLRLMIASVVLLDFHSLFQVALGTCTWSIDHTVRPQALTATILSCSITCNIMAGVMISIGDHRSRKKDVLERLFRQGLTEEAIRHLQKKYNDDASSGDNGTPNGPPRKSLDVRRSEDPGRKSLDPKKKSMGDEKRSVDVENGNATAASTGLELDTEASPGPSLARPASNSGVKGSGGSNGARQTYEGT